jgi:hypothetical protein
MTTQFIRNVLRLNLRRLMRRECDTITTLARRANTTRTTVQNVLWCTHSVNLTNLQKLADAYGVTASELLEP